MLQFMPSTSMITAIMGLKWEMLVSVGSKLQQTFFFFLHSMCNSRGTCETIHSFRIRLLHLSSLFVRLCFADRMLYLSQG